MATTAPERSPTDRSIQQPDTGRTTERSHPVQDDLHPAVDDVHLPRPTPPTENENARAILQRSPPRPPPPTSIDRFLSRDRSRDSADPDSTNHRPISNGDLNKHKLTEQDSQTPSHTDLPKTVTMQSTNSNGAQIFINVSLAAPKQLRYTNMRDDLASKLVALGSVQSVIGIICIIFHIILVAAPSALSVLSFVGHGFWTGAIFIVTGIFGIVGGKQRARCQVMTFNVLSIAAIAFAVTLLGISVSSAALFSDAYISSHFPVGGVVVESLLAFLGLTEAFIAIASSAICCSIGACCGDCDGCCCCCCPPSAGSKQVINIDTATFGQLSGVTFSPGQGFNPNNQATHMGFSNQQPIFQYNASLTNGGLNSQPPPEQDNPDSNLNYTKLLKDHQYTHLRIDPSYEGINLQTC